MESAPRTYKLAIPFKNLTYLFVTSVALAESETNFGNFCLGVCGILGSMFKDFQDINIIDEIVLFDSERQQELIAAGVALKELHDSIQRDSATREANNFWGQRKRIQEFRKAIDSARKALDDR